ncbi:MAG: PHP domain-containing protein [bacterium]
MTPFQLVLADLHVHTVVSACAEVEMIPPLVVRRARELGVGLLAVTDHHSVENAGAVQEAAEPYGIRVLPGMEVQTREEVHVVCLFDELGQALGWQETIWSHLPDLPNRDEFFGPQYVVDATGEYVRTNERLLQTSTDLSFETVLERVQQQGGLALPAHVDRARFSLFANLGMIPLGVRLAGVEISPNISAAEAVRRFPSLAGLGMVQSGDAHRLDEMTNRTQFRLAALTVAELKMALGGEQGRRFWLHADRLL